MPTREVPLDEYASARATASGVATVILGPTRRQTWKVSNEAVSCSPPLTSSTATPTAKLYTGISPTAGQLLAGTYDGNNDSASVAVTLTLGTYLTCVWEGCDPNSVCTLSIYGTMEVPA